MRLTPFFVLLAVATQGCANSRSREGDISVAAKKDGFAVTAHSSQLQGLCYSPESFLANGYLVIDDFPPGKKLHVERVAAGKIEGLDRVLSADREKVSSHSVTVLVPRDSVLQDVFYLQLVLFDCRADVQFPEAGNGLYVLSAVVRLPKAKSPAT